jgi:N-acetylmuramic acid 6-phosphate etherase
LTTEFDALTTEAYRPDLAEIDQRSTLEIARAMNAEDAGVPAAVARVLPQIAAAIDATADRLARGGRLLYLGAGTAGRLGVLDASECPPTFNTAPGQVVGIVAGGPEALLTAVEGAEDSRELAAAARAVGALTVGLSCNPGSPLAAAAELGIEVVVGPELIAGSTRLKAGTAQKLVLNMISTISMIRLGKTYGNLMVDVRASNEKLRARSRRIVRLATGAPDDVVEAALTATGGEVKHAILTILGGVDTRTAERLLTESRGHLRAALAVARD